MPPPRSKREVDCAALPGARAARGQPTAKGAHRPRTRRSYAGGGGAPAAPAKSPRCEGERTRRGRGEVSTAQGSAPGGEVSTAQGSAPGRESREVTLTAKGSAPAASAAKSPHHEGERSHLRPVARPHGAAF